VPAAAVGPAHFDPDVEQETFVWRDHTAIGNPISRGGSFAIA
jgi:hypothetical protein